MLGFFERHYLLLLATTCHQQTFARALNARSIHKVTMTKNVDNLHLS